MGDTDDLMENITKLNLHARVIQFVKAMYAANLQDRGALLDEFYIDVKAMFEPEEEEKPIEMYLCETRLLVLKPDLYRFSVHKSCAKCNEMGGTERLRGVTEDGELTDWAQAEIEDEEERRCGC